MSNHPSDRDIRLDTEPDFILIKRFSFSLEKLMKRHEVAPDDVIGQALGIPEAEVEPRYQSIVGRLRAKLGQQ